MKLVAMNERLAIFDTTRRGIEISCDVKDELFELITIEKLSGLISYIRMHPHVIESIPHEEQLAIIKDAASENPCRYQWSADIESDDLRLGSSIANEVRAAGLDYLDGETAHLFKAKKYAVMSISDTLRERWSVTKYLQAGAVSNGVEGYEDIIDRYFETDGAELWMPIEEFGIRAKGWVSTCFPQAYISSVLPLIERSFDIRAGEISVDVITTRINDQRRTIAEVSSKAGGIHLSNEEKRFAIGSVVAAISTHVLPHGSFYSFGANGYELVPIENNHIRQHYAYAAHLVLENKVRLCRNIECRKPVFGAGRRSCNNSHKTAACDQRNGRH